MRLLTPTLLALILPSMASAYSDVRQGVWYFDAVTELTAEGHLDGSKEKFRAGDTATRAEFIKLIVSLQGGILGAPPRAPSFQDVPKSAWYFGYMEEAAKEGWVRGDGNCYGEKVCSAHPEATISRAEAATLLVRAFALEPTGKAPRAPDVSENAWYAAAIRTAADNCVMLGDDATGNARPGDTMNRGEMAVMLQRAKGVMAHDVQCSFDAAAGSSAGGSSASSVRSSTSSASTVSGRQLDASLGTLPGGNKDKGIRRGEGGIAMLSALFTTSCEAPQVIRSVRIHHHGSGSSLDITNVYAMHEGAIVGTGEYDWRDRSWLITMDERVGIGACSTQTLIFTADFSSKALPHGEHSLMLKGTASIATDKEEAMGTFPIIGPVFTVY